MSANKLQISECNVVIVGKSDIMRDALKDMIIGSKQKIHEASDEIGAIDLAIKYNPKIVFVSMEDNQYWPGLVQNLKKDRQCTIVAYSTGITREAVANAYFAGVDDILVNPKNQKERIANYITKNENTCTDRHYRFPCENSTAGPSHFKKFFWLQAE